MNRKFEKVLRSYLQILIKIEDKNDKNPKFRFNGYMIILHCIVFYTFSASENNVQRLGALKKCFLILNLRERRDY